MSTNYPTKLPQVDLPERWDLEVVISGENYVVTEVTATSEEEAEVRTLAVLDYDFEDDLSGAVAEATGNTGDRWFVHVTMRGE